MCDRQVFHRSLQEHVEVCIASVPPCAEETESSQQDMQGTLREHSGNNQATFRGHLGNTQSALLEPPEVSPSSPACTPEQTFGVESVRKGEQDAQQAVSFRERSGNVRCLSGNIHRTFPTADGSPSQLASAATPTAPTSQLANPTPCEVTEISPTRPRTQEPPQKHVSTRTNTEGAVRGGQRDVFTALMRANPYKFSKATCELVKSPQAANTEQATEKNVPFGDDPEASAPPDRQCSMYSSSGSASLPM
jgi:hypothetical protein